MFCQGREREREITYTTWSSSHTDLQIVSERSVASYEKFIDEALGTSDGPSRHLSCEVQEHKEEGHQETQLVTKYPFERHLFHQKTDCYRTEERT